MSEVKIITAVFGGHWQGSYGLCSCPAHKNTRTPDLSQSEARSSQLLAKYNPGCSFSEILDGLRSRGLIEGEFLHRTPKLGRTLCPSEPQDDAKRSRFSKAAWTPTAARKPASHHESSDDYLSVVAQLCPKHRVIVCKDKLQWILQRYDGLRCGRARWTGLKYLVTRDGLLRAGRALCGDIAPEALAILEALPEHFGRQR